MINDCKIPFTKIYETNGWEYGSGLGSLPASVTEYVPLLEDFIKNNNINTILDYGCGDWQFSKNIEWENLVNSYIGVDVVDSVITYNQENYSTDTVNFQIIDNNWRMPKTDLIICKDVLQHLPNNIINELLDTMKHNSKYMLITNDFLYNKQPSSNRDCNIGGWKTIDFSEDIWNFDYITLLDWNVQSWLKRTILIKTM